MSNVIRVAGVQHSRVVGDKEGNLTAIATWVERAAAEGARIVALPELSNTGYICTSTDEAYFALAEEIPGPTAQFYEKLARDYDITVVGGLFERDSVSQSYYNAAVVAAPSGLVGHYRKTHIPSKNSFMENFYFSPGNLGYPVFDLGFCRIGITICYDRHFPECYRHLALSGAEIVFSINNTGSPHSIRMWDKIMSCNAYCNGLFVVQVNAYGNEGGVSFLGGSAVVDSFGEFITHLDGGEQVMVADCDLDQIIAARRNLGSTRDAVLADFGRERRHQNNMVVKS